MLFNNGNMTKRATEESFNMVGSKTRASGNLSKLTNARQRAENTILKLVSDKNTTQDEVITKVLAGSLPQLAYYTINQKERPYYNDPICAIVQTILLRAKDISYIARALDTTDEEAIIELENSEQEALDLSNPNADVILTPDVQASIKVALDYIRQKHKEQGGTGKLIDIISGIKNGCGYNSFSEMNTADILDKVTISDPLYNPTFTDDGSIQREAMMMENTEFPTGEVKGTVFDTLDKILGFLDKTGQTIKKQAGDIASSSFKDAIKNNLPLILLVIGILGIVIFLSIYAARKNS